jgi:hypothetical protein
MAGIIRVKICAGKLALPKTRRATRAVVLVAMTIVAAALPRAQQTVDLGAPRTIDRYSDVCYWLNLKEASIVSGWDFHAYKDGDTGKACLEIRRGSRDGLVVYRKTVASFGEFRLGQKDDPVHDIPRIEDGTDLTGRGRPDMIVTTWSGGPHCCFYHLIFELKPELKIVARIDDGDGDLAHFEDLDGNGHYYYKGNDWTFAYWDASLEDSAAPAVVLRFVDDEQGGRFHIAMDKMRTPEPTPEQWKKAIEDAGKAFVEGSNFGDGTGSKLWSNMVNMIYTGHSNLAWKLLDETWLTPNQSLAQAPNKDKFLSGFCSQLKTSQYWGDMEKTLEDVPSACTVAKPANREK